MRLEQDCPVFLKIKEKDMASKMLHTCLRVENLEKS
ncbi:lactoylglutathione lyase, partial [Staphylococcus aureus]|nr:lactoylglutathione lyase [Staphylococcus aureus]